MTSPEISRRALGGVTLAGVTAPLLVACGSDDPASSPSGDTASSRAPAPSGSPSESPTSGQGGGEALVATSEVPVGGGVVVEGADVVVTQPAEGTFKCFTAVCTHQGCLVSEVSDGEITCTCHGSVFSAEDGSVLNGPAQQPLEEFPVTVTGDEVTRA